MIRALGNFFTKIAKRWIADAFVFAIVLTIIVYACGMLIEKASFLDMATYWGKGFWGLLSFSMQMVAVLVTGSALAISKPVHRAMVSIANVANTPAKAIIIVTVVALVGNWFNWGFGLIVSAILAKEIAKVSKGIHYPLLVASAYSGFVIWHSGLSASIPLSIAGKTPVMEKFAHGAIVPTSETIFSFQTLTIVIVILISLPILNMMMLPKKKEDIIEVDPALFADDEEEIPVKARKDMTPAEKQENSLILALFVVVIGAFYIVRFFVKGGSLNLDIVNIIFLILGLAMHRTPIAYVHAIDKSIRNCGGIVLQFPFYGGLMGMMVDSGLAATLANAFVAISTPKTFQLFTYYAGGIINMFVPSGGGQWAVQGPIMMPAAEALGVSYGRTAMGIAWGDAWTNMIQPFWALPLLGVAKLSIKDIMGYTTVVLLWVGVVTSLGLLFL
ncbi:MAG TPA: TIGR00366 family protein [Spirochaetales bacterium]|nr:TIGR00366 family protein [Spirochaetales bacterium]HPG87018.1 TIGR00366 family protein [Spirochaetales bacterium]HPM73821.1 TIGR00366 family protein [Spirochaetales bacterium]